MVGGALGGLELDGQPCFYEVGGIEVAATEERWQELDRRYGRALSYGLGAELLDPGAVRERVPLIDSDRILGGLFVPTDGIAKGVRAAEALGARPASARRAGFGGCRGDRHRGRARPGARRRDDAGNPRRARRPLRRRLGRPRVAALAGLRLAIVPVVHQYARTAPLPELAGEQREVVHPILRHQDRSMYFRQHDAYGIGSYRHEPLLIEPEEIRTPGGGRHPSMRPFTAADFAAAREEAGRLVPALGVALRRASTG